MTRTGRRAIAIASLAIVSAAPARAQTTWSDRGYVDVSGWYQAASMSFTDVERPITFGEPAAINTTYTVRSAAGFDAAGGVRIWRNLAAGAGVSFFSRSAGGSVAAQVPHPFYFNRARAVAGDASDLTHHETAVHVRLTWFAPLRGRWQLALSGGPSWFVVDQDLVTAVSVTQAYPFDTADFAGVTSARQSKSRVGFNAGGDLDYMLRPKVGLGIGATFSHASVPLGDALNVDAGGLRVGGGLRFRF
jgi:outer membrane protein with beta-barrel domain